ncbi:MAG: M15 family metallopeptidase [Butyricicoccus sp.]|nr:M15 family metallopeptidase [Butyricicoccus sp.]
MDALQSFIDDTRAQGLSVYLSSSYRGYDEQQYLYNRKVAQYNGDTVTAAKIVAPPGTSEHQTGLCCDITDRYYESKDSSLENTAMYKYMYEHCAEYGFILRYPKDKEDVTGIIYEPWHFRYVGEEAAQYIMENGLCFEEFVELYR